MTLEELKAAYKADKVRAVEERNKLEVMRGAFGQQSNLVSNLETGVSNLKKRILDKLMEREGLTP